MPSAAGVRALCVHRLREEVTTVHDGAMPPYLSPQNPRWIPATEDDLAQAARQGLLEETHYLDIKASIPSGGSSNRELARDLASFAVDGGTIIVGVSESDGGAPELTPVHLSGLPERVEQVARSVPDPPVPVTCTPIPASAGPGLGYLLVEVPATGTAPHMVAGVYMGRGDKTKLRLSDAEVVRLHHARERTDEVVARLLDDYIARDPVPASQRRQAHLFVIAVPVRPRPEMLLQARTDGRWTNLLTELTRSGAEFGGPPPAVRPSLLSASQFGHRADGGALTYNLTEARRIEHEESEDAVEIEFSEDGAVRVTHTRFSDAVEGRQVLFEGAMPDLVRRTVGVAAAVADRTGYLGQWMLGVAATGIAGLPVYGSGRVFASALATVGADHLEYRQYTAAAALELQESPGAVTQRLVGRFLRSIGYDQHSSLLHLVTDEH